MAEKIKNIRKNILIILVFILSSIHATFPIIFNPNKFLYGFFSDSLVAVWTFWWFKYSWLRSISSEMVSVSAYPFGIKFTSVTNVWDFFHKFLAIVAGEIIAYNLQIFLSFFLAGLAMYFFCYYLTKSRIAALCCGIIFTFCPYHFARAWDHLSLANLHWMIFYIFSLFILAERKSYNSAIVCGVCFSLIGLFSSYYYVYFMAVFTIFFIVVYMLHSRFKGRKISLLEIIHYGKLIAVAVIINALMVLPQIWRHLHNVYATSKGSNTVDLIRPFGQLFADSARPLNYFLPTVYHPLLGRLAKFIVGTPLYGDNSGGEQSLYLGIIPLILAFIGYKRWKKRKLSGESNDKEDFIISFFVFCFFAFMIFSFSPYWGDKSSFFIPFPSYFLYNIFPMFRNYARFGVLVMVSVCVLAGFGLRDILRETGPYKKKLVVFFILIVVVLFEFLNFPPYKIIDVSRPPGVYQWLKSQRGDIVIAEYPIDADERSYFFYQTIHEKKMINGAVPGSYAYEVRQKILDLENFYTPGILSFLGAKYVIVHKDKYREYEGGHVLGNVPVLDGKKGFKFVKDFGEADVYELIAASVDPKTVAVSIHAEENTQLSSQIADKNKFKTKETIKYLIKYFGIVPVLGLDIILCENSKYGGGFVTPIRTKIYAAKSFFNFLKVNADFVSYFDEEKSYTRRFREVSHAQGHKLNKKDVVYDQEKQIAVRAEKEIKIYPNTQDPVSAIFFVSQQKFEAGKRFTVYINEGKSNNKLEMKVVGKNAIKIGKKVYQCWKLHADLYKLKKEPKRNAGLTLWFEDSAEKRLLAVNVHSKVGYLTMRIVE